MPDLPVSIIWQLPAALATLAGTSRVAVTCRGPATLADAIDALGAAHPLVERRLRDDTGQLRRFVNIYRGEVEVRDIDGLATTLHDGAQLLVVPSVAGG